MQSRLHRLHTVPGPPIPTRGSQNQLFVAEEFDAKEAASHTANSMACTAAGIEAPM